MPCFLINSSNHLFISLNSSIMKKLSFKLLAMFLMASFVFVSCTKDDEHDKPQKAKTIVDVAKSNSDFSSLVKALSITGLDVTLDNKYASFTVFGPTNAAFASVLTELGFASLEAIPKAVLTDILLYHVLDGEKKASVISTGYYSSMSDGPAAGYTLSLFIDMGSTMINSRANISQTDIMADNGVIHAIDKVILPLSITGHAVANSNFASLAAAVTKAGLADALDSDGINYTVFAPVNDAFDALLTSLNVTLDQLTAEALTPILLYHVVDAFVPAANVASGYVSTLSPAQGRTLSLQIMADASGVKLNGTSSVVATDVVATNGIIHAINEVLLPPTVVDIALDNPAFSILVEAVVKAELVEALSAEGPFTVFAPTNTAFEALFAALDGVNSIDDLTKEQSAPILLAHVVQGNVASTDLSNSTVPTLNGSKSLSINVDSGVVIDGSINVVLADVQGTNGIVHVIDKVIVP